ncbi:MAG: Hsp20/alpha crystallin family protein [Methanobacteriaceae archaeon]|jgi:HSP20 family protein|nr:MAG: heat-shock protein Hsp20 [Methanobacterium sp. BRmetb2]MCC7557915.1 Hsp20/alpha crystallin family protein [Methanobacteriaceae archaeon]
MKKRDHVSEMKDIVSSMMEDTAKTLDVMRQDIEKKIVDYTFVPGKNIIETDESVIVHVVLPGIKKEDIELNLTEKRLKVKAKFDVEHVVEGTYMTLSDKKSGFIRRTVRFPKKVIPQEAKASFENGVLKVEVPKLEKEESFNVKVE